MSVLMNFLMGSGLKIIGTFFGRLIDLQREKDLLLSNATATRIRALQSGEDRATKWSKVTRRILAFTIVGTFCALLAFHVIWRPDQVYTIMINKNPSWLWGMFFGSTDKAVLQISAGSLLWDFKNFVELIAGFYFTKISKGG